MRRGLLAMCLIASMVLAGCLGPSSASWGTGSGAVSVNFSMESTTVKTTLAGDARTISDLVPVGCTPGTDGGTLAAGTGGAVTFTGYLASSTFYDNHDPVMGPKGLDLGVTTAVAIQSMSFDQAASVVDGDGARIDVKQWSSPLQPETGAGSVNLEKVDSESDTDWFVLGLIPTTEDILSGMKALGEWHQPVVVHGYLVSAANSSNNQYGYQADWHKADNDCGMTIGTTNRQDTLVLVSQITLQDATVSANGEADDEWIQGDVPFLGRAGFILFFLAGGIGGAVGLFVVSKQMMMKSAKQSMRVLIGEEGMKKAASVKSDAKAAKAAGMESPAQRQKRKEQEREALAKKETKASTPPKKAPKKEKTEDALGGFDLDSVLASTSTGRPTGSAPSGRKSSVVATESAQEMDRMSVEESTPSSLPASVGQQRRSAPPNAGATNPPEQESRKPPVRRRKAVKKANPAEQQVPEVEPEPTSAQYEEDEDFSDFSF
ncbi:MAG: hypothetical protein DWC05_02750 [Candidatus Poseidoniales archaeon]|nr:MAG: hypothetical protein DWC05_02750 [Candidatus Poseidoniales archaeon]